MLKSGINIFKIILLTNILFADYFISFSFVSKNNFLIYEEFNCVKALSVSNKKLKFLFSISAENENISQLCKKKQNLIIKNLLKFRSVIYSNDIKEKNYYLFRTKLTFPPKRFDIIIKKNTAYFYLKE